MEDGFWVDLFCPIGIHSPVPESQLRFAFLLGAFRFLRTCPPIEFSRLINRHLKWLQVEYDGWRFFRSQYHKKRMNCRPWQNGQTVRQREKPVFFGGFDHSDDLVKMLLADSSRAILAVFFQLEAARPWNWHWSFVPDSAGRQRTQGAYFRSGRPL